jgi:hypothetical protein
MRALLDYRPTAVVSTGAAIALAVLPAARISGVEAHCVESAARTDGLSLTGRLVRRSPRAHSYTMRAVCDPGLAVVKRSAASLGRRLSHAASWPNSTNARVKPSTVPKGEASRARCCELGPSQPSARRSDRADGALPGSS